MAAPQKPDTQHPERTDAWAAHRPDYADMCPVCRERITRGKNITALLAALTEFGYSTLTREEVAQAYDDALAGVDPNGNIIGIMVATQMREAGLISAESV